MERLHGTDHRCILNQPRLSGKLQVSLDFAAKKWDAAKEFDASSRILIGPDEEYLFTFARPARRSRSEPEEVSGCHHAKKQDCVAEQDEDPRHSQRFDKNEQRGLQKERRKAGKKRGPDPGVLPE